MRKLTAILAAALLTLAALPAMAQEEARIHLLHGIPDTNVDVEVGGANVFEDFAFGETQDLSALAGETLVGLKVKLAGTDTVAIDAGDTALPASGNYTIIAHLDADGTPTLGVFANDTSAIAAGEGRIVVRHAAAAPAVDIKANGAVAFANVPNGAEGQLDLAPGILTAEVVPAGADEPVVIGPADLTVAEGASLIVYAVGSLDAGSLTVLTESIVGLGTAPAAVNTGDSPVGADMRLVVAAGLGAALMAAFAGRRRTAIDTRG